MGLDEIHNSSCQIGISVGLCRMMIDGGIYHEECQQSEERKNRFIVFQIVLQTTTLG